MTLSLDPEIIVAFQKEWEPLNASLLPIEHLDEGVFACEYLKFNGTRPIILWDVMTDLAEQPMMELAENSLAYKTLREAGENPFEITQFDRRRRKGKAEKELFKAIDVFNQFSRDFHQGYHAEQISNAPEEDQDLSESTFEHDRVNRLPRYDAWKPERFCVHDHLMGVMGYRFNRINGYLEVTGYATRDHTNYARGSATRSLLLCLLCEWAKQSGHKGIYFVDKWYKPRPDPVMVPHEIIVYARILGVDVQFDATELSHSTCKALFLKLTPFNFHARKILEKSDLSIKACLMAHKGIWTTHQIADLVIYCPMTSILFDGDVQPEQQVQMGMAMEHARLAVMANIAEQMVRVQVEEKLSSIEFFNMDENLALSDILAMWPYIRLFSSNCDIDLLCFENDRQIEKKFSSGTRFAIISWPVIALHLKKKIITVLKNLETMCNTLKNSTQSDKLDAICLMIPAQTLLNQSLDVKMPPGAHLTLMDETLDNIGQVAWRNIQQCQRIRK